MVSQVLSTPTSNRESGYKWQFPLYYHPSRHPKRTGNSLKPASYYMEILMSYFAPFRPISSQPVISHFSDADTNVNERPLVAAVKLASHSARNRQARVRVRKETGRVSLNLLHRESCASVYSVRKNARLEGTLQAAHYVTSLLVTHRVGEHDSVPGQLFQFKTKIPSTRTLVGPPCPSRLRGYGWTSWRETGSSRGTRGE